MSLKKKNEFLDVPDSDEEDAQGYDSDDDLKKGGRVAKRRKIDESGDDEVASDAEREDGDDASGDEDEAEKEEDGPTSDEAAKSKSKKKKKKLKTGKELPEVTSGLKKNLIQTEEAIRKSGVVYISRIPPFMKPQKLRSLLEPYGKINRTFLAPEDPAAHARRVRNGGNKKRLFTEGWVEFVRKKDAKAVCELLNTRIIGGKKGNYYHDDIWNLMYLKGFKWHHLTEQIAAENAERETRMRAEISKSTKENKEFVKNVERAKMLDGMQAKAKKRKAEPVVDQSEKKGPRSFKQIPLAKRNRDDEEQPERVTRVLSKIF
jgi:ESF2/ABP1 family protein